MKKAHRQALRFAYRLLRGDYSGLPYTSRGWIEPDRDPHRPYLNEDVFTLLLTRGYLECAPFMRWYPVYLYRITREGCAALGLEWPLTHPVPFRRDLYRQNGRGKWYPRRFPPAPRHVESRMLQRHTVASLQVRSRRT